MKATRRNFLKVTSLAGGGLMLAGAIPGMGKILTQDEESVLSSFNHFISIDLEGNVVFQLTAHEMGQGSGTGLPMIMAEELGADWSTVTIERADYDKKYEGLIRETTGGSGTISFYWDSLRNMGATVRELLKAAAANRWQVSTEGLSVSNGFVIDSGSDRKLSFGELAAEAATLEVPKEVELKSPADFNLIGKPVKNLITDKVAMGQGNYGINMDLPDMLYASIEKCPVYKGKLIKFDAAETLKVNGVIDVISVPTLESTEDEIHVQEGVAVIATSTWAAFKGRKSLKCDWDLGDNENNDNERLNAAVETAGKKWEKPVYSVGKYDELKDLEDYREIKATYINPHQAHALMEPMNATAHYNGQTCEIWVGTQNATKVVVNVAKAVDIPADKIKVHVQNSGGSFGRRYYPDTSIEAAYLSKQLKKPIKLTWTREDGIRHDYFHPYQVSHFSGLIKEDEVIGMQLKMVKTASYASGDNLWEQPYDLGHLDTFINPIDNLVHQGAWRSVQVHSSSLGKECFIDELAIELKKDPLELRNVLYSKPIEYVAFDRPTPPGEQDFGELVMDFRTDLRRRNRSVMEYISANKLWDRAKSAGKGRGFAIDDFFGRTVCAHIVEVEKDNSDWGIKITKITSVLDCGIVVNPHFGRGQVEGSIIYALSALKYGSIDLKNGKVQQSNFHNNKLLRIDEVPEIEVHFVPSEETPRGLGEPATPPLAPAVLNAIFDATGKRIRKVPVYKEDLLA
ncbi:MAG: molybdopterin cofactor-binding domain-containing protein [Reichenbachiella sp.]|uniref:xanthine dehydrogenase family protein molybdopterin-binding subunit n=1 Tax=Reichenbachiella sp. TaxID=2184521 RepID=UPI003264A88E